jgi:putative serine protease PepD
MRTWSVALLAAILGSGATAAFLLATGAVEGTSRTVIESAPLAAGTPASGRGFTAREIYKRDSPGVVLVRARTVEQTDSPFEVFGNPTGNEQTGSGFVIDAEGRVLTNAHVVAGATDVRVVLSARRTLEASVIGRDLDTDLALLEVRAPEGVKLHPLQLGDSDQVQVGDETVAIGNPVGLDRTLTTGVVSALQGRLTAQSGFTIEDVIQTDATLNPGTSGGPLIDAAGRVIGVNSQIATGLVEDKSNTGVGFAVPINTAKEVIPQLEKDGRVRRAYLGIKGRTVDASLRALGEQASYGVLIAELVPGSPAARAGLVADSANGTPDGDVVQAIDGRRIRSAEDLVHALHGHDPGDSIKLEFQRGTDRLTIAVRLAERPAQLMVD